MNHSSRTSRRHLASPVARLLALLLAVLLPALALGAGSRAAHAETAQASADGLALKSSLPFSLPGAPARPVGQQAPVAKAKEIRPAAAKPASPGALGSRFVGPDDFGYVGDDSEGHPAHATLFQDISGTGTALTQGGTAVQPLAGGNLDDGYWEIPFADIDFKFYGVQRNGVPFFIGTNGLATFNSAGATDFNNTNLPDPADPNDAVYPFWDDLVFDDTNTGTTCGVDIDCGIYYQVVGSTPNRRFIIQWNHVPFVGGDLGDGFSDGHVTFQVQFDEGTRDIRFEYLHPLGCSSTGCLRGFGDSATIGIESADPANTFGTPFTGLAYSVNEPSLLGKDGLIIQNVVFHPPDLEVVKDCFAIETDLHNPAASSTANVVLAGQQWVCRIEVFNHGVRDVANVQLQDTFPGGLTLAGVARTNITTGFTISPAPPVVGPATVDITIGSVPAQDRRYFELGFLVDPSYVANTPLGEGEVCNSVMITNPMVGDLNDLDDDCDLVKDRADLAIQKILPQGSVQAGETFVYTIFVDNYGPSAARGVRVLDDMLSSGAVSLAGGLSAITSDRPMADLNGGGPGDGLCQITTTPGPNPITELVCALTAALEPHGEPPPLGAQSGRWQIRIPLVANDPQSIVNTACVSTAGLQLQREGGPQLLARPDAAGPAQIFTGWLNGTPDHDTSNNCAEDPVVITGAADLGLTKTSSVPDVPAGGVFDYTLVVNNAGPSTATNVIVNDTLPFGVSLRDPNGAAPPPPFEVAGGTGTCTTFQLAAGNIAFQCNLGNIISGGSRTITVHVIVNPNVPPGLLINQAAVESDTFDPDTSNNVARAETAVGNLSTLCISKTGTPDPVAAGGVLHYTIFVSNNGPSAAQGVVINDNFANIAGQPASTYLSLITANFSGGAGGESCYMADLLGATSIVCDLNDIAANDVVRIDLQLAVAGNTPTGTDIISNSIAPSADSGIVLDEGCNDLTEQISVVGRSQVSVTKVASDPSPVAGTEFNYTLTVTNHGPSTAYGVQLTDTLPPGVTFVASNDPRCTEGPVGVITCDFGTMVAGQTITVVLTVRLDSAAPCNQQLRNFAVVSWFDSPGDVGEAEPHESAGSSVTTIDCVSDLRITKLAKPDGSQVAGQPIEYTIIVDNLGPSAAPGAAIKDLLQSNGEFDVLSVTSDRPATCNSLPDSDGGDPYDVPPPGGATTNVDRRFQLDCVLTATEAGPGSLGVLRADGPPNSGRWILTMDVVADTKQSLNNVATAVSGALDPDQSNNQDQVETDITQSADLRVVKFGKPDGAVRAGDILTYTIIVDNLGPSAAPGVALKDVIRSDGTFDVINIDSDLDMTCASDPNPPSGAGTPDDPLIPNNRNRVDIDCTLSEPLPPLDVRDAEGGFIFPNPGRWTITMYVTAAQTQTINNVADVFSDIEDPDMSNNHAIVEHDITDVADLALEKNGPATVVAGTTMVYTIDVVNLGPSDAENVVVYDRLPPGITVTDVVVTGGGSCNTGTPGSAIDRFYCNLGDMPILPDGSPRTITVTVDVDPDVPVGTILENDAFVLSDKFDDYNGNNADFVLTTVTAEADLFISKFCNPSPIQAGTFVSFDLVYGNNGPSTARDVIITDVLPANYDFVSAFVVDGAAPFGSATCHGRTLDPALVDSVTCEVGDLDPGEGGRIVVEAFIRTSAPAGPYTNTASITSDAFDPIIGNNTATCTMTVVTAADIVVTKTSDPLVVYAGEQKTYKITVVNNGPSDAVNVVLTDILPIQVDYLINTGLCSASLNTGPGGADVVTCTIPLLQAGEMFMVTIVTKVRPDTLPGFILRNCATATATTFDPNLTNNTGCSENRVEQKADLKITKFGKNDGIVRAGDILTYTVIVDNLGPSWANNVSIKDVLQSAGKFDLIDIHSDRRASCSVLPQGLVPTTTVLPATPWPIIAPVPPLPATPNINQRLEVDCTLVDNPATPLPADESRLQVLAADGPPNSGRWILTMRVRARQAQDMNNVATVLSGVAYDPYTLNNMAMVEHDIIDVADMAVTKTAVGQNVTGCAANNPVITNLPNQVTAGLELTYTLVVTNRGPSDAENVLIIDRLPPGVVIVPGSGTVNGNAALFTNWCTTGTPGSPADQLTCGLGLLNPIVFPASSTSTIVYRVKVDPNIARGSILENDVRVSSGVFEPNNANNFAHNQTVVNTSADLRVAKSHDPATLVAGELVRYTLAITNDGPSTAKDVWAYDTLPADVVYQSAIGAVCFQDPVTPGRIFCQVGDMQPGAVRYVYLIGLVKPDAAASLINTVTVQSGFTDDVPNPAGCTSDIAAPCTGGLITPDPCPLDNTITDTAPVIRRTDPFILKTDLVDPVLAGNLETYQITFGNNGPSTATNVVVEDLLPLGFVPRPVNPCEPIDPNDEVVCSINSGPNVGDQRRIILESIERANTIVYQRGVNPLNRLDPGETYSFRIVATVEPGYILDGITDGSAGKGCAAFANASGYLFWAFDRATITSTNVAGVETDSNLNNNFDDECTRVNADADLEIKKTDIFGTDPNNGFLQCDPVAPGGTIRYTVTVTNKGPSDAAMVQVTDFLPAGVVLDPAQIIVTIVGGAGRVLEVRDDGRITVILGNSPVRMSNITGLFVNTPPQIGRINAGATFSFTIDVMVPTSAPCGSILTNVAEVTTIAGKALPAQGALPAVPNPWTLKDQTPTPDSNQANNRAVETTTIRCASIRVRKTVSYDGKCPGFPFTTVNQTGQPVTFCFEITNTGDTFLDNIIVTDILNSRTQGDVSLPIACSPIHAGKDPKLPLPPGETVICSVTIPQLLEVCDCGVNSDTVTVTATPVNSGRTVFPCLPPVTAKDTRRIEVPCAGVDFRIQLPVIGPAGCETWLQVQNVGDQDAKAIIVYWGEPGACPPQAAGPLKAECSGLLKPGSSWSFALGQQIPLGARSAVVYGVNNTTLVPGSGGGLVPFGEALCQSVFFNAVGDYFRWISFDTAFRLRLPWNGFDMAANPGEPLAVVVNRKCPDPVDPNISNNAAYTGVSSDQEGARDPFSGSYTFYAPLIFAQRAGLNSLLYIQNSGIECTSLEIWFKAQDNCLRPILGDVLNLAPGETIKFDPNTVVGPDWIGSAWIRSTQPLGVVIDTMGANHFTAYNGVPGDVSELLFSYGDQVVFAPLIYNQMQGWDTAIQVQNHSATTAAKVKVYFLDNGGGILETIVDWICPRGSQTYFLPVIGGLPGNWVGSARIESQAWWAEGSPEVDPPHVSGVVMLEKWSDPARTTRREAVAYNAQSECILFDWQIGSGRGGTQSGSAVFAVPLLWKDYRNTTSELAITNLVPKPGFTDFAIYIYDQNGLLDFVCQKLTEKQVEYINLATWGYVAPHFNGSAVVSAVFWEHDVFAPTGAFERNLVGLGAVSVERVGGINGGPDVPGDESKAFEAFPVFNHFMPMGVPNCPGIGHTPPLKP
jgi:uncharacterized repeat protein (TIGR01451 family)